MDSPGRLKILRRGEKRAKLPNVVLPHIVLHGVEPSRLIRLPRFNKQGKPIKPLLIIRPSRTSQVKKVVRRVKTKVRGRTRKSAA